MTYWTDEMKSAAMADAQKVVDLTKEREVLNRELLRLLADRNLLQRTVLHMAGYKKGAVTAEEWREAIGLAVGALPNIVDETDPEWRLDS